MSAPAIEALHVLTLTGNLLAERTFEFERWASGKTQRAVRASFQVGGKGINVSKMLTRLDVPNTALCFTGGAPGVECEQWLQSRGFHFRAFPNGSPTRVGTVVRDTSGIHAETTFLGPDVVPDSAAADAAAAFLENQLALPGRLLALCGSVPGWSTPALARLRRAIHAWADAGRLVVDSYGPPLTELIRHPLALLKINADELRTLGATRLEEIPPTVSRSVITDGPRSVRLRDRDGSIDTFSPPAVREVSATGSGDVLLACVLAALFLRQLPLSEAVRFAIPYAAANAAHPGVAEFTLPAADP